MLSKPEKLRLTIESLSPGKIGLHLEDSSEEFRFDYFPEKGLSGLDVSHPIACLLTKHQLQFEKILRSAMIRKLCVGKQISCVFIEGFPFFDEKDFRESILIDRRCGREILSDGRQFFTEEKSFQKLSEKEAFFELYTDGSFSEESRQSGFGGLIRTPEGKEEIFRKAFDSVYHKEKKKGPECSSNLMELSAVLEGMKRLTGAEKIRIFTDSRFVIRGMAQWVWFWRHNDWQTAYGTSVKYSDIWQALFRSTEGKLIELKWIKGHSGHPEQEFCHSLAKSNFTKNKLPEN